MYKNASVAHILLAVACVTWVGVSAQLAFWSGFVWAGLMALVLGLAFPSVPKGATQDTARSHCWHRLTHDPMVYFGLATLIFFCVQAVNGGRALVYDASAEKWWYSAPGWPRAPSSVVAGFAWQSAACVCVFFCCCLAVRHTMNRSRRLVVLHGISLNAALLALWALVRGVLQHKAGLIGLPGFVFSSHSAAAVGAYYLLMTAISVGLVMDAVAHKRFSVWLVVPLILNYAGVLLAGNRAASLAVWAYAAVIGVYALFYSLPLLMMAGRKKTGLWGVCTLILFGAMGLAYFGVNSLFQGPGAVGQGFGPAALSSWAQEFFNTTGVALRIWLDHPWVGVGSKGFAVFAPLYGLPMTPAGGPVVSDIGAYLCQYGVIGCGVTALAVGTVLVANTRRLALLPQVPSGDTDHPGRYLVFRLVPMAVALFVGTVFVCGLGCVGAVFRNPMVSLSWGISIAGLGSFLPLRTSV